MTPEAFTVIYNKALDLVSRREHSQYELIQKLNKFGPKKIEMELNFKKVDSSFIAIAIAEYESWTENAQNELLKKFKGVKPTDYNSKMKQKQFLFNRGFSSQIIERIL